MEDVKPVQVIMPGALERANVDSQVATAKQYPRDEVRAEEKAITLSTRTKEVADSCGYALTRGGKVISGPSVHLAKIIAHCWGNMRTETKVVEITPRQVVARGTAWDLENNVASAWEVRRSIIDSKGRRYSDDMITVTGNAASAIAYRNAVFSVVPETVTERVYKACQKVLIGDLTGEDAMAKARVQAIDYFKNEYGITEDEVLKLCRIETRNQIRENEILLLRGIMQSLKDRDTTVEDLMKPIRKKAPEVEVKEKKETMKSKKKGVELP